MFKRQATLTPSTEWPIAVLVEDVDGGVKLDLV